jgi:hypothetical protein
MRSAQIQTNALGIPQECSTSGGGAIVMVVSDDVFALMKNLGFPTLRQE